MPAPVDHLRMHTESAAITSNAITSNGTGRASRSFLQHTDTENMHPSASMGSFGGASASARLGGPATRRARITTTGLATSRVPQRSTTAGAPPPRQFGSLSDITNLPEARGQGAKGKLSAAPRLGREPSVATMQPSHMGSSISLAPPVLGGPAVSNALTAATRPAARSAAAPSLVPHSTDALSPMAMDVGSPGSASEAPQNAQSASEYVPEIVAQLYHEETTFMPRPNYMEAQGDINGKMRSILVDWLVEVHMKYRLRDETLYLAVNLIDRHMAVLPVARRRLQLVGVAGMFVAAKFEEIDPPRVNDFVYITDNTYTRDDIMNMECTLLAALGFEIVVPTPAHFFDYLMKANRCNDARHKETVKYLLELALIDLRMIRHTPSQLVSAALLLSNELFGRTNPWPETMVQASRHSEHELRGCAEEMRALLRAAPASTLQAVRKKYMLQQHHCVARLPFLSGV